jgi:hypothetical protein
VYRQRQPTVPSERAATAPLAVTLSAASAAYTERHIAIKTDINELIL